MNTIFKYTLNIRDEQVIEMPSTLSFLSVQMQYHNPQLWCVVNPNSERIRYKIYCHGTGHAMPSDRNFKYLGTVQQDEGTLIWHFFTDFYTPGSVAAI